MVGFLDKPMVGNFSNTELEIMTMTDFEHVPSNAHALEEAPKKFELTRLKDRQSSGTNFPVVGVGASAGGIEALEIFFGHMPEGLGAAIVVVQHLAPEHRSYMDGILQRKTSLPVKLANQNDQLEPNAVYLAPPGKIVEIRNRRIVLGDVDRRDMPVTTVDKLFRSLAIDCGHHAIAIVLSGTGHDGSEGVLHIHNAGGKVIVQDEATAIFDGMPNSVVKTGVCDLILSPNKIPKAIAKIVERTKASTSVSPEEAIDERTIQDILDLLEDAYQVDFSKYKQSTIVRRIQRRLEIDQSISLIEYYQQLAMDHVQLDMLYRDLLIGVTQFFRDRRAFEVLEEKFLPQLVETCKGRKEIRIWIAACASGEEAYSIAMLLDEQLSKFKNPPVARIFATDLHPGALKAAGQGLYPPEAVSEIVHERLERYFVREGDNFQIIPRLRQNILFSQHNVLRNPPFTQLDFVSCRNLLIYLENDTQDAAIARLHFGLRQGGILFLGNGERIGHYEEEFDALASDVRIYRKKHDRRLVKIEGTKMPARFDEKNLKKVNTRTVPMASLKAYEALLKRLSYDGFLVTEEGQIEHTFGIAGRLLVMSGIAQLNLFELVVSELRTAIQTTLLRSKATDAMQVSGVVKIAIADDKPVAHKVQVEPMPTSSSGVRLYLVQLATSKDLQEHLAVDPAKLSEADRTEIEWLRDELETAQDSLRRLMQELGTRNEQLQASNEELTAANEELQSTNEELQSVNEELYTTNNEHQRIIAELQTLTLDMEVTLSGVDVGVVFVDVQSKIRSLTVKAKDFFGLDDSFIGCSSDQLASRINVPELGNLVNKVQAGENVIERCAQNRAGNVFLMRIMRNRHAEGALMMFIDFEKLKSTASNLSGNMNVAGLMS